MRGIMQQTNNLDKYCAYANCARQVEYTKLKTSTNDTSISQKMRYAQYLRQPRTTCSLVLAPDGTILNPPASAT